VAKLELYGSAHCESTQELREWLEWSRRKFHEYDVEKDPASLARMQSLTGGGRAVPVLVDDGMVVQVGWQGRSCVVDAAKPRTSR